MDTKPVLPIRSILTDTIWMDITKLPFHLFTIQISSSSSSSSSSSFISPAAINGAPEKEMMRGGGRAPIIFNNSSSLVRSLSTVRSHHRHSVSDSSVHYQMKATKYWNDFYKRHHNKFFKDRHYLEKDWGTYFSVNPKSPNSNNKLVLEVGCGVGNTIFPLISAFPNLFVHACDFAANAIQLVKSHEDFREDRINAFVCDITKDDLCETIVPSSVDLVTLIFTMSAISPEKMPFVFQNIKKVLKPNGYVLLRDYAIGDFAQEKLKERNQMIGENFYVRGDGTCAYYFSEDFLSNLSRRNGFEPVEIDVYCKKIENHSRNIVMDRRWIRGIFCSLDHSNPQSNIYYGN